MEISFQKELLERMIATENGTLICMTGGETEEWKMKTFSTTGHKDQ